MISFNDYYFFFGGVSDLASSYHLNIETPPFSYKIHTCIYFLLLPFQTHKSFSPKKREKDWIVEWFWRATLLSSRARQRPKYFWGHSLPFSILWIWYDLSNYDSHFSHLFFILFLSNDWMGHHAHFIPSSSPIIIFPRKEKQNKKFQTPFIKWKRSHHIY